MISDEALMGYLDGHVDSERAREIEVSLAADAKLRARLAALESTDAEVRAAFDALLEAPVPDRLTDMVRAARAAQADNVVALRPRPRFSPSVGAVARALRATPPWLGLAAAAQAAIIVLAAVVLHPGAQLRPAAVAPSYEVLGAKAQAAPVNAMVVFKPQTPERELRAALRAANARIVGGPTPADAYLLHVPEAERSTSLTELRGRVYVTLAEPVDAPGAAR